jgi:hypothetical protein
LGGLGWGEYDGLPHGACIAGKYAIISAYGTYQTKVDASMQTIKISPNKVLFFEYNV